MKAIYTRPETKVIVADMPVILSDSDLYNTTGITIETNVVNMEYKKMHGGTKTGINWRPNAKENNGNGIWDE